MSLAPILQIRVIRKQGHSWGVSAGQWRVWSIGFMLWLAYGISITDWPLIVNNIVSLSMGITTLVVIARYRRTPQTT
jgi:MtN3 and saliva related transmembrane protein